MKTITQVKVDDARVNGNEDLDLLRKALEITPIQKALRSYSDIEAEFGLLRTWEDVATHIKDVIPEKTGFRRDVGWVWAEDYQGPIPDKALISLAKASATGKFSRFLVAFPKYDAIVQPDPWLLGQIKLKTPAEPKDLRYVVLAYWD